ncbi:DUF2802 domain-containing protein [Paraferrimonas sp. SM1919]|uniref:DUF2802 domain-containing protein n=1 Tax=Paraferrimonas sp. SM1919 TaxID=2662263 RepID=UPI0013D39150|nr:DUF2802 domain-containing protein [Paraferrimonas sp. SM1919]
MLQTQVDHLEDQLHSHALQLSELHQISQGLGKQLRDLHSQQIEQSSQITQAIEQEPQARLYNRASKMLELGADVEEIMRECELPKAEAELMRHLYHSK